MTRAPNERFLSIDTQAKVVRVYKRHPWGREARVIDSVEIVQPQQDDVAEQLELLRQGKVQGL